MDTSPPDITQHILMPMLQNRWRMAINSRYDAWSDISRQAIRCNVNYKTKRMKLWIEQGSNGDLCSTLFNLMNTSFRFRLDCLDGNNVCYFSTEFLQTKMLDHNMDYDYAKSNVLTHSIIMSFEDLRVLEPENQDCSKIPRIKV